MAQLIIDIGTVAGDETGDPGRTAFIKVNDNFTELYAVSLNSSGTVNGTDQLFTGHVGIGGNAAVDAIKTFVIDDDVDMPSGVALGAIDANIVAGGNNVASQPAGLNLKIKLDDIGGFSTSSGITSLTTITANQNAAILGINGYSSQIKSDVGSAFGLGNIFHYQMLAGLYSGGKPITEVGLKVPNLGQAGVSTTTAIQIDKQAGSSNNFGLILNGNDLGADIAFGTTREIRQHYNGSELEFEGSGITRTASTVTHDAYVTIAINGTAYKFMLGS